MSAPRIDGHAGGEWALEPEEFADDGDYAPPQIIGGAVHGRVLATVGVGLPSTRGNGRLLAMAQEAPHLCDVPRCPGPENARRLADYERLSKLMGSTEEAVRGTAEVQERLAAFDGLAAALKRIADQGPRERLGSNQPANCIRWVDAVRREADEALRTAGLR